MRTFVSPRDPILTKTAEFVLPDTIKQKAVQNIILDMLRISSDKRDNNKGPILVGLAAPQIGISKRIIIVDTHADGKGKILKPEGFVFRGSKKKIVQSKLSIFINPEIIDKSDDTEEWYEGCLSTDRVCGIVSRPTWIMISAVNQTGKEVKKKFTSYVARIFLHEVDHLNGIVFVDHISNPQKLHWVEEQEFHSYRNNQAWRTWKKLCSFNKWEKIKGKKV